VLSYREDAQRLRGPECELGGTQSTFTVAWCGLTGGDSTECGVSAPDMRLEHRSRLRRRLRNKWCRRERYCSECGECRAYGELCASVHDECPPACSVMRVRWTEVRLAAAVLHTERARAVPDTARLSRPCKRLCRNHLPASACDEPGNTTDPSYCAPQEIESSATAVDVMDLLHESARMARRLHSCDVTGGSRHDGGLPRARCDVRNPMVHPSL
jgi:hypothetical protein